MARLSIVQGDTAVLRVAITNQDATPADLTGYDATFTIKRSRGDSDEAAVFQGTITDGSIVVVDADPTLGLLDVTVLAANTTQMRPGKPYYWDAQISQADQVFTPCNGTIFAEGEITQT
jgi:hypothetical protein